MTSDLLHASEWLTAGDRALDWRLQDSNGADFSFLSDRVAGKTVVVLFIPTGSTQDKAAVTQLETASPILLAAGAQVFIVEASTAVRLDRRQTTIPVLVDTQRQVWRSFGKTHPTAFVFVLRRNYHIHRIDQADRRFGADLVASVLELEDAANAPASEAAPPILRVPEVFSSDECKKLVSLFETTGEVYLQNSVAQNVLGRDYKMRIPEHMREDRVDHYFFDEGIVRYLKARLMRIYPEIRKAFHYEVTKLETLRIARYRGRRLGYCIGHRDNVPPYEYRRFAMSINLNVDDFEGGELRFPEFGNTVYRPATGEAMIFSSSLLHEALEVRSGTRYVFLAFMF